MTKSTITREPITHDLKIYPEFFSAVCTGVKRAELRKNDRDYRVGDTLHLMETPRGSCHRTGEFINVKITHIADVGEWMPDYVLLSVELQECRKADSEPVILYRQVNPVNGMKTYWAELDPEEFRHLKQHTDENAEFMTLYRHAQPTPVVPVVPDDVLDALQKVARIRLDLNNFDGDRRGIADCLCDAEEALIEVVNRRAAMLQAERVTTASKLPGVIDDNLVEGLRLLQCMLDDYRERNYGHAQEWVRHIDQRFSEHSEAHGDDAYCILHRLLAGEGDNNSPVIPDGYVMVPVEPNGDMLAAAQDAYGETDGDIASTLRAAMLAAAQQEGK
ncbi:DUF3850 domain-containing protein [Klebsiella quasipneumoniae]|uniref:DUF3850 domain-containing protein n=1 Tax=Klebsiella quasipneumoniae TaxID=1463165 RepID=UPI00273143B8|nr:DUF3850 domain-containing protein [Klebsiella quasipneumoniae]MDP1297939.1 DUF3850 domain-containing protein [Klebsiella quasipneumoniae]